MIDVNRLHAAILNYKAMMGLPAVAYLNPADHAALAPEDTAKLTATGASLRPDVDTPAGSFSIGRGLT